MIRLARTEEVQTLLEIYESAKRFMHANGNPNQWNSGYPDRKTLVEDIEKGHLFSMYDECTEEVYGCFALIGGTDPTYLEIDGEWKSDSPYGTIHRIAGNGKRHGIFAECVDFARKTYNHIRVDTHEDNKPMQKAIMNSGFKLRGTIYLADGSPRLAFDFVEE